MYSSWRTVKPDGWSLKAHRRLWLQSWKTLRSNWRASASRRAWWGPRWKEGNERSKGLTSGLPQCISVCCLRWMSSWLSYATRGRTWWRGWRKTRRISTSSWRSTKPSSLRSAGVTSLSGSFQNSAAFTIMSRFFPSCSREAWQNAIIRHIALHTLLKHPLSLSSLILLSKSVVHFAK